MKRLQHLTLILLVVLSISAQAQEQQQEQAAESDCLTKLSTAEQEFAAGRFYGVPDFLKECLSGNRFSNEEKVRVYMLLTQVYLLSDNPPKAEESFLSLLHANPEFVASESIDPIDVVYLSKKFTTTPIFTPHVKAGGSLTQQFVLREQNTFSRPDTINNVVRSQKMLPGWTLGGGIEWNITDNIGIGGEALLNFKQFKTSYTNVFEHDRLEVTEKQTWLDIPLYVRYGDNFGKVRPYAYAGFSVNLLLAAKVAQNFTNVTPGDPEQKEPDTQSPSAGADEDIRFKRIFFNRAIVAGGGVKIKWGKDFILIDVRYMPGLTNLTNPTTVFYSEDDPTTMDPSVTLHANVSDMFRINNYGLTFGYVKPLYNPRKVKKAKTRSVYRKLSKQSTDEN